MKANSPSSATADWLASFAASLKRGDAAATAALFADDGYWRRLSGGGPGAHIVEYPHFAEFGQRLQHRRHLLHERCLAHRE